MHYWALLFVISIDPYTLIENVRYVIHAGTRLSSSILLHRCVPIGIIYHNRTLCCWDYKPSDIFFFESLNKYYFSRQLFGITLEVITNISLSLNDCFNNRIIRKVLKYSDNRLWHTISQFFSVRVPKLAITPASICRRYHYRFIGLTGQSIRSFQTTTWGIIVTVLKTINVYRDIVLKIYIDPWIDLVPKYLDSRNQ